MHAARRCPEDHRVTLNPIGPAIHGPHILDRLRAQSSRPSERLANHSADLTTSMEFYPSPFCFSLPHTPPRSSSPSPFLPREYFTSTLVPAGSLSVRCTVHLLFRSPRPSHLSAAAGKVDCTEDYPRCTLTLSLPVYREILFHRALH